MESAESLAGREKSVGVPEENKRPPAGKMRILVADDHQTEREYVKTVLGYAGYEVLEAEDGEAALELVLKEHPDLVISDILMPKLDGLELVRQMRSQPEAAATRVIIWSASFRQQEAQALTSALAVERFLKKPVEPGILLSSVDEILRAPPPALVPVAVLAKLEEAHQHLLNDKLYKKTLELEEEIGAREQVEAMLRENQRRYVGLVGAAMDAIISTDAEQRIVLFNNAAETLFRRPAATVMGAPVEHLMPERFRAAHREQVRQFAGADTTTRAMGQLGTLWGLRANGEEFPIEASISKVHVGGQWQFTVILRDITERKEAEERLRESERRFRLMSDAAPVLIWTSGIDKGCTWFNRPWLEFTGRTLAQEVGSGWVVGVHSDDVEHCLRTYTTAFDRREPFAMEYRLRRHDGEYRWVYDKGVPWAEAGRGFSGYIGSCFDVTERKRAEAAMRQLNQDLERRVAERTAELTHANEALLQSNEELRQFAFIASHDLQTPLRSIAGFAQLLQKDYRGRLDAHADELIGHVVDSAKHMYRLIHDLLVYVRVDTRAQSFVPIGIRQVFDDVVGTLASSIHDAGAKVSRGALPVVPGDRGQLTQLLQNLIGNALKYHDGRPPRVQVSAERQGQEWVFSVRDNGIGIAAKHQGRIFEIFRRLHTQEAYPGTGIGLAVCRRIVERHGGRIWVESAPGQGSIFHFTLPAGNGTPSEAKPVLHPPWLPRRADRRQAPVFAKPPFESQGHLIRMERRSHSERRSSR